MGRMHGGWARYWVRGGCRQLQFRANGHHQTFDSRKFLGRVKRNYHWVFHKIYVLPIKFYTNPYCLIHNTYEERFHSPPTLNMWIIQIQMRIELPDKLPEWSQINISSLWCGSCTCSPQPSASRLSGAWCSQIGRHYDNILTQIDIHFPFTSFH